MANLSVESPMTYLNWWTSFRLSVFSQHLKFLKKGKQIRCIYCDPVSQYRSVMFSCLEIFTRRHEGYRARSRVTLANPLVFYLLIFIPSYRYLIFSFSFSHRRLLLWVLVAAAVVVTVDVSILSPKALFITKCKSSSWHTDSRVPASFQSDKKKNNVGGYFSSSSILLTSISIEFWN